MNLFYYTLNHSYFTKPMVGVLTEHELLLQHAIIVPFIREFL